ncbi:hypothetical protein BLS_002748 [Venturia inaequalis]|uniref:Uncharacterized protein n=1 Tax=Venturia inaequalis TaxID=5025 RepID=A0A8H3U144_VENIN|nr:hypothetical protein BLS_002748 [Venturia inaequalis]KAE9967120.1 hypothetical protein EG327_011606 [Venturia inaequalis]KAE9978081.1 hypothetical protein EG328_001701 [Venturia inaequalis]
MASEQSTIIATTRETYDSLNPQGSDFGFLLWLYNYQIPQNYTNDASFLRGMFIVAEEYHIVPLKTAVLAYFTYSLDEAWRQDSFVDLVVKLYEPTQEEPLYDLRVRVADYVARRISQVDPMIRGLMDGMPDFGEDVMAAVNDQVQENTEGPGDVAVHIRKLAVA